MKTLLTLFFSGLVLSAQTSTVSVTFQTPTENVSPLNAFRVTQFNNPATLPSLTQGINGAVTSIHVSAVPSASAPYNIILDAEEMVVTAQSGTAPDVTLTVTRGALGTAAAAHSASVIANVLKYGGNNMLLAMGAMAKGFIAERVQQILKSAPNATISTANTAIATQQATIDASLAAAVQ